ncbi:MAG: hypothetical protein AAF715_17070 [Myxococcota bacterium]
MEKGFASAGLASLAVVVMIAAACAPSSPPHPPAPSPRPLSAASNAGVVSLAPAGPSVSAAPGPRLRLGAMPPPWPRQPQARWVRHCRINDVGVHPSHPWLTVACADPEDIHEGAVMVVDVDTGTLRSVSVVDNGAGWDGEGLLQWDATGRRLASNVMTNAIGVFEGGALVGVNGPDDGRDHPVVYAWVDHRVYTDTGHFFDPKQGRPPGRFDFAPVAGIRWRLGPFRWVPSVGAVVGAARPDRRRTAAREPVELVAYAPQRETVVYRKPMAEFVGVLTWSPDGRWAVAARRLPPLRARQERVLDIYDTHIGERARAASLPGRGRARVLVRNDGALIVSTHSDIDAGVATRLEVAEPRREEARLLSRRAPWPDSYGPSLALAPDGQRLAQLLADGTVDLFDLDTGARVGSFSVTVAPDVDDAQVPARVWLRWVGSERIVIVSEHAIGVWSTEGDAIAQLVMPR